MEKPTTLSTLRLRLLGAIIPVSLVASGNQGVYRQVSSLGFKVAPAPQIATLTAAVRRVVVDVVVTDSYGRPVLGLKQEDFRIEEDRAAQPVRSFDVHMPTDNSDAPHTIPALPPNTFLNISTSQPSGPLTVLLYDLLNTYSGDGMYGQQEFFKSLKQLRRKTSLAVFGLSDKLYLLQGFTEERSLPDLQKDVQLMIDALNRNPPGTLYPRAAATAEALNGVARFLESIPVRKNLIWYTSGFPESILPGPLIVPPPPGLANSYKPSIGERPILDPSAVKVVKKAIEFLTLSRVAVYPVDLSGIRGDSTYSATRVGPTGAPLALAQTRMFYTDMSGAMHSTMDTLADDTGGHAFYGTNDLQEAIRQAINDGSTYYSLTYEPTNAKYDGSLRHIKVTLKQPGYDLAYRRSYYADDLNAVARAAADAPVSPLTPALERGTPLDHGLFVEAHLEAAGAPVPATPDQMRVLAQYEAMRGGDRSRETGPQVPPPMMQQYVITYALVAHQVAMPEDSTGTGNRKAALEFGAIAYDDEGRKLNGLDTRLDDPISPERYAKLLDGGYRVQQPIWVPVATTTLRLAVRDVAANRTGSLEIPLPLSTAPAPGERKPR